MLAVAVEKEKKKDSVSPKAAIKAHADIIRKVGRPWNSKITEDATTMFKKEESVYWLPENQGGRCY